VPKSLKLATIGFKMAGRYQGMVGLQFSIFGVSLTQNKISSLEDCRWTNPLKAALWYEISYNLWTRSLSLAKGAIYHSPQTSDIDVSEYVHYKIILTGNR
jgi:hypothetical protein